MLITSSRGKPAVFQGKAFVLQRATSLAISDNVLWFYSSPGHPGRLQEPPKYLPQAVSKTKLPGSTLPATQLCVFWGDIWKDKILLILSLTNRDMKPQQFGKFTGCSCVQTHITLQICRVQMFKKLKHPSPTFEFYFLYNFTIINIFYCMWHIYIYIQGDHKFLPWLQTFITRKQLGIKTYIFFLV